MRECICTFAQKTVGDGCEVCNPPHVCQCAICGETYPSGEVCQNYETCPTCNGSGYGSGYCLDGSPRECGQCKGEGMAHKPLRGVDEFMRSDFEITSGVNCDTAARVLVAPLHEYSE